jgi:hypothetical protein
MSSGASLLAAVRGRPAPEVRALVADLKANLELLLEREPDNYNALVLLGEINLRGGLCRDAQAQLYRASLQQPPSWEAFQRTSLLLRRAEEQRQKSFDRVSGAAPPLLLRRLAASATTMARAALRKLAAGRAVSAQS